MYHTAKEKIQNLKYTIVFFIEIIGSKEKMEVIINIIKNNPKIFEKVFL